MEVQLSHSSEPVEVDGFRVKIHDNEFLIKGVADGLHIIEITNDNIMIRPNTANSVVLVTRTSKYEKHG